MSQPDLTLNDLRVSSALTNLAIARGTTLDDAIGLVYVDALEDLDPALVERACRDLARLARSEYETALPSVGTIRERVAQVVAHDLELEAARKLLPLPTSDDDRRAWVFCRQCHDDPAGLRPFWCVGGGASKDEFKPCPMDTKTERIERAYCGRRFPHGPHTYVELCGCVDTNPIIARKRAAAQARKAS